MPGGTPQASSQILDACSFLAQEGMGSGLESCQDLGPQKPLGPQKGAFQVEETAVSKGVKAGRSSSWDNRTHRAGPAQDTQPAGPRAASAGGLQRQDPGGQAN